MLIGACNPTLCPNWDSRSPLTRSSTSSMRAPRRARRLSATKRRAKTTATETSGSRYSERWSIQGCNNPESGHPAGGRPIKKNRSTPARYLVESAGRVHCWNCDRRGGGAVYTCSTQNVVRRKKHSVIFKPQVLLPPAVFASWTGPFPCERVAVGGGTIADGSASRNHAQMGGTRGPILCATLRPFLPQCSSADPHPFSRTARPHGCALYHQMCSSIPAPSRNLRVEWRTAAL